MNISNRPYAVFDLDGTLIRWQLFHAIVDLLGKDGKIRPELYSDVKNARMAWKRRESEQGFDEYQKVLIEAYNSVITQLSQKELEEYALKAFEEHKDQCYVYTKSLMAKLKSKGYLIFAISGSFDEVVKLVAKHYGFDDSVGTKHIKSNQGEFTGEIDVMQHNRKVEELEKMKKRYNATNSGSIAVGDSMGDLAMLESVEHAIAFNPSKELFNNAKEGGWKIVVERKNVIYELDKFDQNYRLAD